MSGHQFNELELNTIPVYELSNNSNITGIIIEDGKISSVIQYINKYRQLQKNKYLCILKLLHIKAYQQ